MRTKLYSGVFLPEELFSERSFDYEDDARYDESEDFDCDYCGCRIGIGEEKLRVEVTGDVIHRKCWVEYAEENTDELCCEF